MPEPPQPNTESLNSALNLWQEAVEKASVDLDRIVNNSIKQLESLGQDLEEALASELKRTASRTEAILAADVDELSSSKDELQGQLTEFERQQVERMLTIAQEARARIDTLVIETKTAIMEQFRENLKDLTRLLENPRASFDDMEESRAASIEEVVEQGREKTVARENEAKESLASSAEELGEEAALVVAAGRASIDQKLEEYGKGFDAKIKQVLEQLDELGSETSDLSSAIAAQGTQRIEQCRDKNEKFLSDHIDAFSGSVAELKGRFEKELNEKTGENLSVHSRRLEYQVSEAKATINHVTADANARVVGIHKSFYGQLKRLERRYQDRIKRQLARLEAVMAQERAIPTDSKAMLLRSREELCQRLETELKARGGELVKSIRKQVEQLEDDFRRASSSSSERVDSIRLQTIESLEKQVRIIRSELDRINKSFRSDLAQVSSELPEIEERGRVAAMSVAAYRASMLDLESD
ncbi:MAG: hypothetical protein IPM23_08350 [Candidatus Melainabacteria bacterium]|nr:hypothetical protein [Candidatus Melainabacteria bacterium]